MLILGGLMLINANTHLKMYWDHLVQSPLKPSGSNRARTRFLTSIVKFLWFVFIDDFILGAASHTRPICLLLTWPPRYSLSRSERRETFVSTTAH